MAEESGQGIVPCVREPGDPQSLQVAAVQAGDVVSEQRVGQVPRGTEIEAATVGGLEGTSLDGQTDVVEPKILQRLSLLPWRTIPASLCDDIPKPDIPDVPELRGRRVPGDRGHMDRFSLAPPVPCEEPGMDDDVREEQMLDGIATPHEDSNTPARLHRIPHGSDHSIASSCAVSKLQWNRG